MSNKHNQDHYKVAGTEFESRGITKRNRDRFAEEAARLRREAPRADGNGAAKAKTGTRAKAKAKKGGKSPALAGAAATKPAKAPRATGPTVIAVPRRPPPKPRQEQPRRSQPRPEQLPSALPAGALTRFARNLGRWIAAPITLARLVGQLRHARS